METGENGEGWGVEKLTKQIAEEQRGFCVSRMVVIGGKWNGI